MDLNSSPHRQKAQLVARLLTINPVRARSIADRFVREGVPLTLINYYSSFVVYDLKARSPEKADFVVSCFGKPYGWNSWLSIKQI